MANYGELIDRVLENVGDPDAGAGADVRARILTDMQDLLQIDIPNRVGGPFAEGFVDLHIGGAGGVTITSDGRYSLPSRLRSPKNLIRIDETQWHIYGGDLYTDPLVFFEQWPESSARRGAPTQALLWGLDVWFRPAPEVGGDYNVRFWGTAYPDYSSIAEATAVARLDYEPVLVAGATVLEAARTGKTEVLQLYGGEQGIWLQRLNGLRRAGDSFHADHAPPAREY